MAQEQNPDKGNFQVFFDGLIIGRFNKDNDTYQLGVVSSPGHKFQVIYVVSDDQQTVTTELNHLPDGRFWSLAVEGTNPNATQFLSGAKPVRLQPPSDPPESLDFRWVLDVESREDCPAHPRPLHLDPGKLQKIIKIKNGRVYTSRLTGKFDRSTGSGPRNAFGSTADDMSVELPARKDQFIVLRDEGTQQDILRIPIKQDDQKVTIRFLNLHHHSGGGGETHFEKYYSVFSEVTPEKQHHFFDRGFEVEHSASSPSVHGGEHTGHDHNTIEPTDTYLSTKNPTSVDVAGMSLLAPTPICGPVNMGSPGDLL